MMSSTVLSAAEDDLLKQKKAKKAEYDREYREKNMEKKYSVNKAYRDRNRDELREKSAAYYQANKERISESSSARRKGVPLKNPESHRARSREYARSNKDAISRRKAERHKANPEVRRSAAARLRSANPERYRAYRHNREARLRDAGGSFNEYDIAAMFELQKRKCANCLCEISKKGECTYHVDHIVPVARGGSNNPSNLQLLCAYCNRSKGAQDPIEWAQRNGRLI